MPKMMPTATDTPKAMATDSGVTMVLHSAVREISQARKNPQPMPSRPPPAGGAARAAALAGPYGADRKSLDSDRWLPDLPPMALLSTISQKENATRGSATCSAAGLVHYCRFRSGQD
jgi:hypothetical protein